MNKKVLLSLTILPLTLGFIRGDINTQIEVKGAQKASFLNQNVSDLNAYYFANSDPYYSRYSNLVGNIVYDHSVTLKNTFYYPNATYEEESGVSDVLVKENVVKNIVYLLDDNVIDTKTYTIKERGYHEIKVSTYYLENGIMKISKSYLETFTFFLNPIKENLVINKTKYYFEYYSSFDALVDDIEASLFKTLDGQSFKTTLSDGTVQALKYNFNRVVYDYDLETTYDNVITLEGQDVELVVTSARNSKEAKESYSFTTSSNTDFVIDYDYIRSKDLSMTYVDLFKDVYMKDDLVPFLNGVEIKVTKGDDVTVLKGVDVFKEGTPFASTCLTSTGQINFSKIYDECLSINGTLDVKDGSRTDVYKKSEGLNFTLTDYRGQKVDVKKDVYLVDYDGLKEETRINLDVKNDDETTFYTYEKINMNDEVFFKATPFAKISIPRLNDTINDYEGITKITMNKYRVNTFTPNKYTNTYKVTYKSPLLKNDEYSISYVVKDDVSPSIIAKYNVFWFDKIDKRTFLDNYTNYVRFSDNVGIDLESIKVSTPSDFISNKETYFDVSVKDTSGNKTSRRFTVKEKSEDNRSAIEKGWDTFCYNWGHFFRGIFGIKEG